MKKPCHNQHQGKDLKGASSEDSVQREEKAEIMKRLTLVGNDTEDLVVMLFLHPHLKILFWKLCREVMVSTDFLKHQMWFPNINLPVILYLTADVL